MRISTGHRELISESYSSFNDMLTAYKADERDQGRDVALYALSAIALALALWLLERAAEKALDMILEIPEKRRRKQQEMQDLQRSEELRTHFAAMRAMIEEARQLAREGNDIAKANRQIPGQGNELRIELEGGAEKDLSDAFVEVKERLPGLPLSIAIPGDRPVESRPEKSKS
jgi:hypothetical protein